MAVTKTDAMYESTAFSSTEEHAARRPLARNEDIYPPNTVFVNVYDITEANAVLSSVGVGAHHVGIQVFDKEYQYGRCASGTGIGTNTPCYCPPHVFREQFAIGLTPFDATRVRAIIRDLEADSHWRGTAYHLIRNNCVSFAEVLAQSLLPPDVRAAQAESNDPNFYRCPASETVQLSSGAIVSVPVLMPPHVNRLTRSAVNYVPHFLVDKIDEFDREGGWEMP